MKAELKLKDVTYDINTEAEYQGKRYVSIHKMSKFKEETKHQNLTCKELDWPAVKAWLSNALTGQPGAEPGSDQEVPF